MPSKNERIPKKIITTNVEYEKQKQIEILQNCVKNIFKHTRDSSNLIPLSVWNEATKMRFPVITIDTPSGKYLSKIKFFQQLVTVENDDKKRSRHKVAALAFEKFLNVSHPSWTIYKDPIPKLKNLNTLQQKQKIGEIKTGRNQAEDILRRISPNDGNLTPVSIWNISTKHKYKVETIKTFSTYVSKIEFFDEVLTTEDSAKQKSRHKVATQALEKLFNISHPKWNIYKSKNTSQKYEKLIPKVEFFNTSLIQVDEIKENSQSDYFRPSTAKDSRHNVCEMACTELLGISSPHWKSYKGETFQKLPSVNSEGKVNSKTMQKQQESLKIQEIEDTDSCIVDDGLLKELLKNPLPEKLKFSSEKIKEILEKLSKSAREILAENEGITPDEFWSLITKPYPEYKFVTEFNSKSEKYESTIEFQDKKFTKANVDQHKSESMVACQALDELLGLEFNEGEDINPEDIMNDDEFATKEEETKNKCWIEFSKRAKDILSGSNSKIDKNNPIELWNGASQQKFPITTTITEEGNFSSKIEFFNIALVQVDEIKENSQSKLARVALKEFLGIDLSNASIENSKPQNVSTTFNSEKEIALKLYRHRAHEILSKNPKLIESTPASFWSSVTKSEYRVISSVDSHNQWIAKITFFDEILEQKSAFEKDSRYYVCERACNELLGISLPHWKSYKGQTFQKLPSVNSELKANSKTIQKQQEPLKIQEIEDNDSCNVDDGLLKELLKNPLPEKLEFSSEKIKEILEKLSKSAREILAENEGITPDEFWSLITKPYPEYKIVTEFNSKSEKYESTIEFQDKKFTKANVDQHKSESMVACQALDELLELEFNEGEDINPEDECATKEVETKNKCWIEKLKDLQNSLRDKKKCLNDIPCSEIFLKIGFNFDFEYSQVNEDFDPILTNIKENTSRFLLKQLLIAAYED